MLDIDMKSVKNYQRKDLHKEKRDFILCTLESRTVSRLAGVADGGPAASHLFLTSSEIARKRWIWRVSAPHPGNRLARTGLERTAGGREMSQLTLEGSFWLQELLFSFQMSSLLWVRLLYTRNVTVNEAFTLLSCNRQYHKQDFKLESC